MSQSSKPFMQSKVEDKMRRISAEGYSKHDHRIVDVRVGMSGEVVEPATIDSLWSQFCGQSTSMSKLQFWAALSEFVNAREKE